ncbi:hypothetical protein CDAR_292951 [Caerostris darwini]|uniref:Reverse transcriptase domain-containing protein n=1 Tax=Caerostris darwini TaxID=1538125 RepID=A0AAV4TKS4_9ARAC|nr:hypothetical protein CDAR_292951 [Caerostris darwini]
MEKLDEYIPFSIYFGKHKKSQKMEGIHYHKNSQKKKIFSSVQLAQHNSYRAISLMSIPAKVSGRVIINRLKTETENVLPEEQAGFRNGAGTI